MNLVNRNKENKLMANNRSDSKQKDTPNKKTNSKKYKNLSGTGMKDKEKTENKRGITIRINKDLIRDKDRLEKEYIQRKEEEEKMAMENAAEVKDNVKIDVQEKETIKQKSLDEKMQQTNTESTETKVNISGTEAFDTIEPNLKSMDSLVEKKDQASKDEQKSENSKENEKKDKRPSKIDLKDKSETFKKIIDIAILYEKVEADREKLKEKNKGLLELNKGLKEDKESLEGNLAAIELLCKKKQEEIDGLKAEVTHRNEVIDIVKADRTESAQEFKNALAASLKNFYVDFEELKLMDMSDDVGYAIVETLDNVFKILEKNGICIQK